MKIAIVGAGWVGCHLASKLIGTYDVDIYEAEDIFHSTSFYNQNRLHLGFHYARNQRTRLLCRNTFGRFNSDYEPLISNVDKNIYAIHDQSIIDFGTYTSILKSENIWYDECHLNTLNNIQGCINTKEKHIDFLKAKNYFKNLLGNHVIYKKIDDVKELSQSYDFVINCTNNFIKNSEVNSFYELALTLLFEKINPNGFDALTIVDGNFFSIYPYQNNIYTLTDVEFTPLFKNDNLDLVIKSKENIDIESVKIKIVSKVLEVYPDFNNDFKYHGYFTSIKSKTYNNSADRYPIIGVNGNIINCFTGKIQGIYVIEDFIKNHILGV